MAKATNTAGKITKIKIRMYRGGTGDFFILQFKKGNTVSFQMMIDCGCIKAGKDHFVPRLNDLKTFTKNKPIDLLVVTHEHADHINGFELAKDMFKDIFFKKVWFSWTENDEDPFANDLRKNYSELDKAIKVAVTKLNGLDKDKYFEKLYALEDDGELMAKGKIHFIQSLDALNNLNITGGLGAKKGKVKPTMVELLKEWNVIKADTEVEFLEPGEVKSNIAGATGIRFYVMGPPKNTTYLDLEHSDEGNFEQREKPSKIDFALISTLAASASSGTINQLPFEAEYEMPGASETIAMQNNYKTGGDWRKIDYDWLFSTGSLAMRYENSINNTSLALAIQFEDSERVLLFPADAELGNWLSWHDGLEWPVKINGQTVKKKAEYFLNKTVFYKVGHHMSQNGTAKEKGIEMMTSDDLTVMATLDFRKIHGVWLNTMPNDFLAAELISKSKGKLYFEGERNKILPNIKTDRVTVKKTHENTLNKLNKPFDGEIYAECEIDG
jgi:hypothetical protein